MSDIGIIVRLPVDKTGIACIEYHGVRGVHFTIVGAEQDVQLTSRERARFRIGSRGEWVLTRKWRGRA